MFASWRIYYIPLRTYYVFTSHYINVHIACIPRIWFFQRNVNLQNYNFSHWDKYYENMFCITTYTFSDRIVNCKPKMSNTNSVITKMVCISSVRYYIPFRSNGNRQNLCKWNDFDGDNYFTWYTRFGRKCIYLKVVHEF